MTVTTETSKEQTHLTGLEPDLTATDPYRVLGILHTASQVEIKRAYFTLIRQYPPETEGEKFKIVRLAYEKIKSAERRAETDIFLPQAPPVWQPSKNTFTMDTAFYPTDVLLALRRWGDLGQTDFQEDFKEIVL